MLMNAAAGDLALVGILTPHTRYYPGFCFANLGFCFAFLLRGFLLRHGGRPRDPRGRAMPRQAVMPFKNVDAEPCFACGATENTRWYYPDFCFSNSGFCFGILALRW